MALHYLDRWAPKGLLLESVAEAELAAILESGPGTEARAVFAQASGWLDALRAVAEEPNVIARRRLIIFPQVGVARFRADFMVVCADVRDIGRSTLLSRFAFFVECDGKIGHAETIEQIVADHDREQLIRTETGMQVLRFSGAEVMYQRQEVQDVIAAHVEALAAMREHGDTVGPAADRVLEAVARLSCHRALRSDYTAKNAHRSGTEPFDPYDPYGEEEPNPALKREAEWDAFLDLRLKVAQLRYAVARARRAAPDRDEDEIGGELKPFHQVLMAALEGFARDFEQPT